MENPLVMKKKITLYLLVISTFFIPSLFAKDYVNNTSIEITAPCCNANAITLEDGDNYTNTKTGNITITEILYNSGIDSLPGMSIEMKGGHFINEGTIQLFNRVFIQNSSTFENKGTLLSGVKGEIGRDTIGISTGRSNFINEGNVTMKLVMMRGYSNNLLTLHNKATGNFILRDGIAVNVTGKTLIENEGNMTIYMIRLITGELYDMQGKSPDHRIKNTGNLTMLEGIEVEDNSGLNFINEGNCTIGGSIIEDDIGGIDASDSIPEYRHKNREPQNTPTPFAIVDINNSGTLTLHSSHKDVRSSITLSNQDDIFTNTGLLDLSHGIDGGDGTDTFTLGSDRIDSFDKHIINFENINKNDSGTWNLEGNISGAQNININRGKLNFSGSLDVNKTLTVNGDLNLSGSLIIDISNTSADIVNISGEANIAYGELIIQMTADTNLSEEWEMPILTAGTLNQQFNSYSYNSLFHELQLDYNTNQIILKNIKGPSLLSLCAALNPSENIASLIDNLKKGKSIEPANRLITKIYSLTTKAQLCRTVKSLSPEPLASAAAGSRANLSAHLKNISARLGYYHVPKQPQNNFAGLVSDHFGILNLNNNIGEAPASLWIRQTYGKSEQDADTRNIGFDTNSMGISIGKDYLFGSFLFGISGGYFNTDIQYDTGFSEGDITSYNISAYGSYAMDTYYIDSILTYSNHNYDINRNIIIESLAETANANWNAYQYSAYIEGGYKIPFKNNIRLTPIINLEYSDYSHNSFTETGSIANLVVSETNYYSLISGIGLTLEKSFDYQDWILQPHISCMLKHNFSDVINNIQTEFSNLSNNVGSFTISGYDQGANNYTLGLGLRAYTNNNLQIHFNYDFTARNNSVSHELGFGLKFYF